MSSNLTASASRIPLARWPWLLARELRRTDNAFHHSSPVTSFGRLRPGTMAIIENPDPSRWPGRRDEPTLPPVPPPPHNPDVEARVAKLEALIPTLATREDVLRLEARMHQELHALTWKLIGVSGALVAAVFFIARTVH